MKRYLMRCGGGVSVFLACSFFLPAAAHVNLQAIHSMLAWPTTCSAAHDHRIWPRHCMRILHPLLFGCRCYTMIIPACLHTARFLQAWIQVEKSIRRFVYHLLHTMDKRLSATCHAALVFWGHGSLGIPLDLLSVAKPLPASKTSCIYITIIVHKV